ncbi:dCTP deaminase domain-containing protein [Sphingomonas sp. PAMC 26605]|uniref:dCTP deaminase domain-containing protein n=1 Tax=Sphingomonas sp. PAMC 26605 TaxID=1112214 RepID=UPI00026CD1E7|nr:deoxycytidine deaminase-like protein [Sphingomonas sp. PAMC 26605]
MLKAVRRSILVLAEGLVQALLPEDEPASISAATPAPAPTPAASKDPPDEPEFEIVGATDLPEAERRYLHTKEHDPFPGVPPALLNSAHIEDYMIATAMVFPYQSKRRKSASYAMRVGSEIAFWDPKRPRRELPIRPLAGREAFKLPPNSLVYVQTKELFQLPNYMAVRFNLHIDLVHKGLLLGTGPLVDPGFRGHLMIPLHNMTANTYVIAEDDELIWAEFTKTSLTPEWTARAQNDHEAPGPSADFAPFPKDKSDKGMADYFERALEPHALRSGKRNYPFPANAIPSAVERAQRTAEKAKADAKQSRLDADKASDSANRIKNWGIGTILAVGIALVTLIWVTMQMVQATVGLADTTAERVRTLSGEMAALRRDVANRDASWTRTMLVDYCLVQGNTPEAQAERLKLSGRVAAAEAVATASAIAAGLPNPFPKPLARTAEPAPNGCTVR